MSENSYGSIMILDWKCPFGSDHICIEGYRYKPIKDFKVGMIAKPLPQDLDELLFVGKCDCCVKASGGVK